MTKINRSLFLLFFTVLLTPAQDLLHPNPYWLNLSLGGSPNHLGIGISYNKALEELSYQVSINGNAEGIFDHAEMTTGLVGLGFTDQKSWLLSSLFLGPSISYGEADNSANENVYFWAAGLAFNAQAYLMPFPELFPGLGLGAEFFYNFNAAQTESVDYRHLYVFRLGLCLTNLHQH